MAPLAVAILPVLALVSNTGATAFAVTELLENTARGVLIDRVAVLVHDRGHPGLVVVVRRRGIRGLALGEPVHEAPGALRRDRAISRREQRNGPPDGDDAGDQRRAAASRS